MLDISTLTCYEKFFSKTKKPVNKYFGVSTKVRVAKIRNELIPERINS